MNKFSRYLRKKDITYGELVKVVLAMSLSTAVMGIMLYGAIAALFV